MYCTITVHGSQGAVFVLYNYSAWRTWSCNRNTDNRVTVYDSKGAVIETLIIEYCTVYESQDAVIETLIIELQCMTHKEL